MLNLSYMSLYGVQHQPDLLPSIWIGMGHTYGVTEWNAVWPHFVGLNTTTTEVLCKWSICWIYCRCHCTMFSIRTICSPQHWPWHSDHLWCCEMVCWPHFIGLDTTTNELLCKWHICWIYCTYHCTAFSIRKIVSWHQHQHWNQPYLWCCQMVCWPHFVSLNTTTNELLCKWHICWIYHTCHCTAFSIGKIGVLGIGIC